MKKMEQKMTVIWTSLLFLLVAEVSLERTKDKMYESIEGAAACFKRLNGTHQFGCTSSRSGNVGVIHLIDNHEDLQWLLEKGDAPPYMAVLGPDMFRSEVLVPLRDSAKVSGILLSHDFSATPPENYSPEDTCPNRYSGLPNQCSRETPWNPYGMGLLQVDWGFPMFYLPGNSNVTTSTLDKIRSCYNRYNVANSQAGLTLCAIEMVSHMYAAVSSEVCIRRSSIVNNFHQVRMCDALGDRNIWGSLPALIPGRPEEAYRNRSVILVTARLDSTSMFDQIVPGATSPVTGIVAMLATAHALSLILPQEDTKQTSTVLFALLHGESYDYIGSQRLVWDMAHGQFPPQSVADDSDAQERPPAIYPRHLGLLIELEQLTQRQQGMLTFHISQNTNSVDGHHPVKEFISLMTTYGKNKGILFNKSSIDTLPPASLQTFLRNDSELPGLVIADHSAGFTNRYYHGIFDDIITLNYTYYNGSSPPQDSLATYIANFSTTLAQTLYNMVTNSSVTNTSVDATLVDELLHCYLENMNCTLFNAVIYDSKLEAKPPTFYIGVDNYPNVMTQLTAQTLAYLTGQIVNQTKENCSKDSNSKVFSYLWINGKNDNQNSTGVCVKTTVSYSTAQSPAFVIDDYDWASGQYSTWTESVWREFRVRMFLKPSPGHEILTLCVGIGVTVLSFLIVWFINARSQVLFGSVLVASGC